MNDSQRFQPMSTGIAASSSHAPAPPRFRPWRPAIPAQSWRPRTEKIRPTADTVIVLWMGGGMAATETFDPKRYTPFEKGMESKRVLSTFPSRSTRRSTRSSSRRARTNSPP